MISQDGGSENSDHYTVKLKNGCSSFFCPNRCCWRRGRERQNRRRNRRFSTDNLIFFDALRRLQKRLERKICCKYVANCNILLKNFAIAQLSCVPSPGFCSGSRLSFAPFTRSKKLPVFPCVVYGFPSSSPGFLSSCPSKRAENVKSRESLLLLLVQETGLLSQGSWGDEARKDRVVCCWQPRPQAQGSNASCSRGRQRLSKPIAARLRMAVSGARNAGTASQTRHWDSSARGALRQSLLPVQQATFF
jgi:hypothetical protein